MLFPVQESACIITGISYEGTDTSGKVNWAGLTNIHILKHEQAIRFQVRIRVLIYTRMYVLKFRTNCVLLNYASASGKC